MRPSPALPITAPCASAAVAQQHERQARRFQHRFGFLVFEREAERRGVGVQQAGVGDQRHARTHRRVDHSTVLRDPLADLARRDQQQLRRTGERSSQRVGTGVVGLANLHTEGGQIGRLGRFSRQRNDVARGHAVKQVLDDKPAELTGGACDDDHDGVLAKVESRHAQ
jgi:hypothetical protein